MAKVIGRGIAPHREWVVSPLMQV